MAKTKDHQIAAKNEQIEMIKQQMRKQAQEFDDMMTTILEKLTKEILISTAPKQLLSAGVPIQDQLSQVTAMCERHSPFNIIPWSPISLF